jgi:ATP-dependent helicase HrpA
VTVHVPLTALPGLRGAGFDWHVPGLRRELVIALIRALPKDLRRQLVPIPGTADAILPQLRPRKGTLREAVARELERVRGVRVPEGAWDALELEPHLRLRFSIEDTDGSVLATGTELDALREELRPRLREELARAAAPMQRTGLTEWAFGDLPRTLAAPTGTAYPALVDEGATVGVRVVETPEAQRAAMAAGTRRLLALTVRSPARRLRDRLDRHAMLTLADAPHASLDAVVQDATTAALDELVARAGGPVFEATEFGALRDRVAGELEEMAEHVLARVVEVLDARRDVRLRLDALPSDPALADAALDVAKQLGALVFEGFATATGAARLADVVRYLRAAERRLERLPAAPAADRDRMRTIHELERDLRARRDALPAGVPAPPELVRISWMLQELRVAQFAEGLGVRGQVSSRRVRRALADLGA